MRYRSIALFGGVAIMVVALAPLAGQAPRTAENPAAPTTSWTERTAWGDPDLQGIWRPMTRLPLERPKEFAEREFLTDAEVAARERQAKETQAKRLAGELQTFGSGQFDSFNSIWGASRDRIRISRRTSAIIDPPSGRLPPWTPQQVKRWEARQAASRGRGAGDSWEDRSPYERCIKVVGAPVVPTMLLQARLTDGTAVASGRNPVRRILQAPGYVAMVMDEAGQYRIIPLDGRPAVGPKIRQWVGDARGHWEGNTLVVEITNINDQQDGGRFIPAHKTSTYLGSGETLRVIERFTRVDADTIEYRYTIDDPEVYTRPYTVLRELTRDDRYAMAPDQCHENNESMAAILAGARADEPWALGLAAERAREHQQRLEELKAEWETWKESR